MAPSVDPLYELYMYKGLVPREIASFGIIAMICCVGIGLNSSLVYVTIKTKPVTCILGDPSNQSENHYFTNISALVIYCGDFLCYTLIWLIIWRRKSLIPKNVKKLTISLSVFMSIALICYILNIFLYAIITPLLNLDAFTIEYFVLPISLVLQSMAYGSSAPVLYFCNGQYRRAFRKQFGHQEQQVAPVQYLDN
uniref:Uncharacterized protein n=1 Tax=Globodera rostochiensis TaxID=31243 RepID=A0A914HRP7_GLORO